ncbi:calcium-binding protein, partial [Gemmobacter serpentinus]|uniref:calcium-binding protein n=1 Tax=Gemmobacter serpentinus TaxID=2652247 RepID=UPI0038512095
NLNGEGNGLANVVTGNAGHNILKGGNGHDRLNGNGGADTLVGGAGNDTLQGGAGNDRLQGGKGADALYGGSGRDTFVFASLSDSTVKASGRDTVYDFNGKAGDRIALGAIDANSKLKGDQAFDFIGTKAFTKTAGELRYHVTKGDAILTGDVNGDGKADFAVLFDDVTSLSKGFFIL